MSPAEHRKNAPEDLHVGVLTVSDTRAAAWKEGRDEDKSGRIIQDKLDEAGFTSERTIVPDEEEEISESVEGFISDSEVDVIVTTGGTGITFRDITVDVIRPLFEIELPGFGESLRRLGYEKVGGPGILTRATAGLIERKPVFCLPGAPNAVDVGMDLILPDLAHIVKHARE